MSQINKPQSKKHSPSQKSILLAGLVGGLVGAVVRGGITFSNLHGAGEFGLIASLPSAGIGLLTGAIAGSFCRIWLGLVLGAFLSAIVFALFVAPIAFLFSLFNAGGKVIDFSWTFLMQKAFAGAVAGGVGGLVGRLHIASLQKAHQTK